MASTIFGPFRQKPNFGFSREGHQSREWLCRTLSLSLSLSYLIFLALLIIFNCAMVRRSSSSFVVVRHTQKALPIVHAAAGARVPVKWHLADLRFRFLAREIDLKSWNHVF